jgi:hypothetical protein
MDIRKSRTHSNERFGDDHRFEHWYRDNQVYFVTATVKGHAHAFESEAAKQVFWTQWEKYTKEFEYTSWVTSLMSNHYHDLGYNRYADNLPLMMQRIHGSVAKLVNDLLDVRITPFWIDHGKQNYFDGCIGTCCSADALTGTPTYSRSDTAFVSFRRATLTRA